MTKPSQVFDRQNQMDRERYEENITRRFGEWVKEIEQLRSHVEAGQDVSGTVGDEATQIDKLEGQLGMLREHFYQFQHTDTVAAWQEMQDGIQKKVDRLEEAIARARQRIQSA